MADNVTTKAPESDATPEAIIPGDTIAQEGSSMGEHCVTDRPTPAGEIPTGELTKLGGIDAYISKPSDYPHSPSKLLLLLTGGTGIKSTNNQLQADKFATEGFLVIMPDQFGGDSAPNSTTIAEPDSSSSFIEQFKVQAATTVKAFMVDMWLARHTAEKVLPILYKVIEAAKEEFADAVANGGGIYAVGYCFGAKYVLLLGGEQADPAAPARGATDEEQVATKRVPLIKAGAIAHGTLVTAEDLHGVKVPVSLACVENDNLFPEEILEAGRKSLADNQVEHEIQIYKSVPHGFAVIGDYEDRTIKEAQQQAYGQILGWIQSH